MRAALAQSRLGALGNAFVIDDAQHEATLLSLSHEERCALARNARLLSVLGAVAWKLGNGRRFTDALTLYDAALHVEAPPTEACCNALWAVQNGNSGLGVMPERARRYLARATPFGRQNPAIFLNAVFVALELGDIDAVLAHTRDAVRYGANLAPLRSEPVLASLRETEPRFAATLDDPALLEARLARVMPTLGAASAIDWKSVFTSASPVKGATEAQLTALLEVWAPLSDAELAREPPERQDAMRRWRIEGQLPPTSYLDFLRYSNGGTFASGDRVFRPFFEVTGLRNILLGYGIPEDMPHVLPFAFDGGGVFCAFDMREPPKDGEFPIVAFHSSTTVWEEASEVAASFPAACRGTTRY